ncbi:RNA polymerase sigma factor [Chitinophaga eiseniae]|uniref:Sigma-70 family RNA polymerase sigma factor n=1 Tax=Chitinophaga eiseniae TaxID=634771 RepID=A0A847SYA9_9BACT|nr:sigma-70 family RNA polymerase sigma factor [Chitinophaga eiseniae]NLR82962.1 sigma-70 family RNA polymerase sigma factor [Chitinophaga eiseniae]
MIHPLENEKEILREVAAGSRLAYTILYRHYFLRLYRFVEFFCENHTDAEEVVQDCFLKIWERRRTVESIYSFERYIFRMAKNRLYDIIKQEARRRKTAAHASLNVHLEDELVEKQVVFNQYYELSQQAIAMLTPRKREIFLMSTQQGMSLDEIAAATALSRAAVKKHLYESIHFIKSHLKSNAGWFFILLLMGLLLPESFF